MTLAIATLREAGLPPNISQMIELASRVGALASLLDPEAHEAYLHAAANNVRANFRQVVGQIAHLEEEARKPSLIVPGVVLPRG